MARAQPASANTASVSAAAEDCGHGYLDLRLRLDEVAEREAQQLRLDARRAPSSRELRSLACRLHDARRASSGTPGGELAGDPPWAMLVALYGLPARGELLNSPALTRIAGLPPPAAQRWQAVLAMQGLIERGPEGLAAARQLMRLTDEGRELVEAYLTRLFYCGSPAPPDPDAARVRAQRREQAGSPAATGFPPDRGA